MRSWYPYLKIYPSLSSSFKKKDRSFSIATRSHCIRIDKKKVQENKKEEFFAAAANYHYQYQFPRIANEGNPRNKEWDAIRGGGRLDERGLPGGALRRFLGRTRPARSASAAAATSPPTAAAAAAPPAGIAATRDSISGGERVHHQGWNGTGEQRRMAVRT
jgi:hypothetical protein